MRTLTVLGALGAGPLSPLLAVDRWDGGSRRVVLTRPAPEAAAAVAGCASELVVGEEGRVVIDGRPFGVTRYVPGLDVDELLARAPLAPGAVDAIVAEVRRALAEAPAPHGALSGAVVRVTPAGAVRLVGFTGRADDPTALEALAAEWREACTGDLGDLAGLAEGEPAVRDHPLRGRVWVDVPPPPMVSPKVRTASFAGVTLILGLLSGWFLAAR